MSVTDSLLLEIARPRSTRESIAAVYRVAILSDMEGRRMGIANGLIDWPIVNAAILKRYSIFGLKYIKVQAWKHLDDPPPAAQQEPTP